MTRASNLLAIPAVAVTIGLLAAGSVAAQGTAPASQRQQPSPVTGDQAEDLVQRFTRRVEAYVSQKKKLEEGLPPMKPGAIASGAAETHESVLAARIREARAGAQPGDIFGDAVPYFRDLIRKDMRTRSVAEAHALLQESPSLAPVAVNASYPVKAALATVPALLLVNLPRLPDGLEYRFMGRDLILRDRGANLIVDFIAGAVPVARRQE